MGNFPDKFLKSSTKSRLFVHCPVAFCCHIVIIFSPFFSDVQRTIPGVTTWACMPSPNWMAALQSLLVDPMVEFRSQPRVVRITIWWLMPGGPFAPTITGWPLCWATPLRAWSKAETGQTLLSRKKWKHFTTFPTISQEWKISASAHSLHKKFSTLKCKVQRWRN